MNCSATLASLALLLLTASVSGATTATFHDAVVRMQYAVYTADAASLQDRLEELQAMPSPQHAPFMQPYHVAYGYWQLAQLHAASDGGWLAGRAEVQQAARRCADHARQTLEGNREMAEAHALLAVCQDFSRGQPGGGSSQCARSAALAKAVSLAPGNPRVGFIAAACRLALSNADAGAQWLAVVARFEALPPARANEADWGHAQALVLLGEVFLQQGEPLAARDALERALLLVPEFSRAQQLLRTIATSG